MASCPTRTAAIANAPEPARPPLTLLIAAPRGFCAGVVRAIDAVENALSRFGAPVYVRRPIVHNDRVMQTLKAKGAVFVEGLDEVPDGAVVLFSAHGTARRVADEATRRELRWFDAVCPLVLKVHREVVRHHEQGRHVLLIGHPGHPEIEGTLGQLPRRAASILQRREDLIELALPRGRPVAYAVQTTYSVEEASTLIEAIRDTFDDVRGPTGTDICYATSNRQAALRAITERADAVIVVGAGFSSNANRLAELARDSGCDSVQLVADAAALDWTALAGANVVALTSAASTPEDSVQEIIAALGTRYCLSIEEAGTSVETTRFRPLEFSDA